LSLSIFFSTPFNPSTLTLSWFGLFFFFPVRPPFYRPPEFPPPHASPPVSDLFSNVFRPLPFRSPGESDGRFFAPLSPTSRLSPFSGRFCCKVFLSAFPEPVPPERLVDFFSPLMPKTPVVGFSPPPLCPPRPPATGFCFPFSFFWGGFFHPALVLCHILWNRRARPLTVRFLRFFFTSRLFVFLHRHLPPVVEPFPWPGSRQEAIRFFFSGLPRFTAGVKPSPALVPPESPPQLFYLVFFSPLFFIFLPFFF